MKSWEEKQKKVAEEANGTVYSPILRKSGILKPNHDEMMKKYNELYGDILENQKKLGQGVIFIPPSGKTSIGYGDGSIRQLTVGDSFDKYLFSGDEEQKLPTGFSYGSYSGFDPAVEKKPICCQPEDFVNIGFAHDKWVCKVCDKEKGT